MISIKTLYQHYLKYPLICIDTRAIEKDCLFFALKGENFDANIFALAALEKGAAYAIVSDANLAARPGCIYVEDVLTTLQELAEYHRSQLTIPVIGLTGSNGKTTTKELIYAVLREKYNVFATKGNLNNHIGVPLSVLSITNKTDIAVIEMGANHQQEIALLCEIAKPTHGLITNVGMAHLEGFGGFEGVKKGKGELYAYLKKTDGIVFLRRESVDLQEMCKTAALQRLVYYGTGSDSGVYGQVIDANPLITMRWSNHEGEYVAQTHLTGRYNTENILAAICVGNFFGLPSQSINRGLERYNPVNNRSQLIETGDNRVISDFYNANPSSMAVALENLSGLSAQSKMIIVGDMFELGSQSDEQHAAIIAQALSYNFNQTIFVGEAFFAHKREGALFFQNRDQAKKYLSEHPPKGSLILLKGSRGMALEQLLPLL